MGITIGVDGNDANVKDKVGVSVYAYELLKEFQKRAQDQLRFVVYLKRPPNHDLPNENRFFIYQVVPGSFLWSQIFLPFNLFLKRRVDLFFSPAHYAPRFSPIPTVVTIHDLSFFYFPDDFLKQDLFKLKLWTSYSVKNAKRVIAVSKNTKNDILRNYHLDEKKVKVIYNGFNSHPYKPKSLPIAKPFILYVGTLQPRKNIQTLISAFAFVRKSLPDLKVVISGKKGWLYEKIFASVLKEGLESEVVFTGYVESSELVWLYKNAMCFVLPSLYEGFGIPLLEAMNNGCPVISSNTSSLPEIGRDACLYFNPQNEHELSDKIIKMAKNTTLRKMLIEKGYRRSLMFSWKECAKQTLELLINGAEK